jgi:CheY-like chemotaxis protein/HPt (histidine-containing phosphotransfer) domain-containing protein
VTEGVHDRHRRAPRPLAGIRVLIADDHDATARLLVEQARGWGMLPASASSTKDVIARLTEAEDADESFRLLLVDAQLPDTGGLELAERLRNDPRFETLVVLVLHTATRPASPDLARRLSIAAQLPKPVHPTQLFESLLQALEISLPPTPPRYRYRSTHDELRLDTRPPLASASPAWVPASRILVVDDSPGTLEVIQTILEDQGHTIETADGGLHALERFQAGRFDVVLLDLQMPGMDGFEVCAAFRAREAGTGHRVPIIAMTANALRGDRDRSLVAGMNHFITKPVRRGELFASLLEAREPTLGSEAAAPPGSGPVEPVEIDWSAMAALVDGDRDLLREVVEAYVVEIREHLERLPAEIDAHNLREARRRAHSLRGAMGVFRATEAEAAAARLEAATSAGNFGTAATLVEAARTAVGKVLPLLEAHLRDA